MKRVQILIAGGGASGMAAAIAAKKAGAEVLVLEKKAKVGKKLLVTGNGKCNLTNCRQDAVYYHTDTPAFPQKIIGRFGWEDTTAWFAAMGLLTCEKDGYIYPASGQASCVRSVLEREMRRLKVTVHTQEAVCSVKREEDGFFVDTGQEVYLAKCLILSVGGMAAPNQGSEGDGYAFASSLGHRVIAPLPALTSLVLEGGFFKEWSGARLQAETLLLDGAGTLLAKEGGEVLLTAHGVSGIPVFQLSRFAAKALRAGKQVTLVIDSMPAYDRKWLARELQRRRGYGNAQSARDMLEGMVPDKYAAAILRRVKIANTAKAAALSDQQLCAIAGKLKAFRFGVSAVSGFEKAQVTAGGVALDEVDADTMESLLCRGLYLTGELLDVDGCCGGYNLQWAWATGSIAGRAAAEAIGRKHGDLYNTGKDTGRART